MIKVTTSGSFAQTQAFLDRMKRRTPFTALSKYGPIGVAALQRATPRDSAETANAWYYEIVDKPGYFSIHWLNSHKTPSGDPIAVLLQYGHGTRQGGYVQGRDYINPTMHPIFDQIAADMWKEVTK